MINDKGKVESSSYRCRKWKEEKEKRVEEVVEDEEKEEEEGN